MSDTDSPGLPAAHPTTGGKSLQSFERPRYKSYRKKFRKMRHEFDLKLEENKQLFKDEYRLEAIAKRLREEIDGLLEICLDINQNPAIPPELRFNVALPDRKGSAPVVVPKDITPHAANQLLAEYHLAVEENQIPPLDLHVVRDQIDQRLAEQDVRSFDELEAATARPRASDADLHLDPQKDHLAGYLTLDQETEYLQSLDAKLGDPGSRRVSEYKNGEDDKARLELSSREFDRHNEMANPQSQHNWLRSHSKTHALGDLEDAESLGSHDAGGKPIQRRRGGGKNLVKQVGDRAVERAREGYSPGAASGFDDDEPSLVDEAPSSSRKRGKDPDGTYRAKGGKSGSRSKRKRSGEEIGGSSGSGKKAKTEIMAD